MLQSQPHSSQICETVDQIVDYFYKNPENLHSFILLPLSDKTKHFSDLLKLIKSAPKGYKLNLFLQDLSFLIQSFLNVDNILENPSDIHLVPYIISSLFFEINEFTRSPDLLPTKQKLLFSFTHKTKLANYLTLLLDLLSEDQSLLDQITSFNAFEIVESLLKIMKSLIEVMKTYDILEVEGYLEDIMHWGLRGLKTLLCERNLIVVNKLIKHEKFEDFLILIENERTTKGFLEILILLVKYGSLDHNFQGVFKERHILRTLALLKSRKIPLLLTFLDLSFFFEFPSFNKSDLLEIQGSLKKQLGELTEENGGEFINRIYQFSFCDFNLIDRDINSKRNALNNLQKEDKYIRQNFMEKIVITPSFIEVTLYIIKIIANYIIFIRF